MTNARLLAEWVLLLLAALGLVLMSYFGGWLSRFDLSLLDFANEISIQAPDERITLVEIDDRSLEQEGVWPWDREQHARLIERFEQAGARAIAFDILFLEPTRPQSDQAFASAMEKSGKVLIPFTFTHRPDAAEGIIPAYPEQSFLNAAAGIGHVAVHPDSDGVIRNFEIVVETEDGYFPHLAKSVADFVQPQTSALTGTNPNPNVMPDPSDNAIAYIPIHSRGSYPTISASDVIQGNAPDAFMTDKVVIIGATAQGMGDRYGVPAYAGRIMSGVELQANLIDALLNDRLIEPVNAFATIVILFIAVFCLFFSFWYFAPRHVLVIAFSLILVLLAFSLLSVILFDRWLPVAPALLAMVLAYPFWGWRRLSAISRQLERQAGQLLDNSSFKKEKNIEGFDIVARHFAMVKSLTGKIRADWIFLRGVLNASPDPMLVFDGKGHLALMNDQAHQLFPKTGANEQPTLQQIVKEAEAQVHKDDEGNETVRFDNGREYLLARSTLNSDVASEILDLRDVTDLRENERQRQQMLEFLSHYMRSPQVAIIGLSSKAMDENNLANRFKRIEGEARRTLKLADDFVQIARLESIGIDKEDADVGAILDEAVDRAYPSAKAKDVVVKPSIPDEPVFAHLDASALSRAIDNLVGNAIKFSEANGQVDIMLRNPAGKFIEIEIKDDGPGLPEERRKDPFARFGAHDRKAGPSAGLGLTFVEKVVLEHGGNILVESEPGKGTRFVLHMPRD